MWHRWEMFMLFLCGSLIRRNNFLTWKSIFHTAILLLSGQWECHKNKKCTCPLISVFLLFFFTLKKKMKWKNANAIKNLFYCALSVAEFDLIDGFCYRLIRNAFVVMEREYFAYIVACNLRLHKFHQTRDDLNDS